MQKSTKISKKEAIILSKLFIDEFLPKEKWYQNIKPYIEAIILFGSVAKGMNRIDSDIDILIFVPLGMENKYAKKGEYFYKFKDKEFNIVLRSIERLEKIAKEQTDVFQVDIFRNSEILWKKSDKVRKLISLVQKIKNMNYLFTLHDKDIFKKPKFLEVNKYEKRITVKAIVINPEGKYGFVTSPRHGFYLLAGGGTKSNNLVKEIKRECDEELNVKVEIIRIIGTVSEYRNRDRKNYETTCFFCKVVGELTEDTRTGDEKINNLKYSWFDKKESLRILKEQQEQVREKEIGFYNISFNLIRDLRFFEEYLKNK
jgi:predicted nucleotidyltransferase/ADP-ribose pyrophosphatase YjhB (NUDIX family)|tara:strand:- start:634 stop:1575 length:942 start_codon:yes stop_codon:yes gene_type:complete